MTLKGALAFFLITTAAIMVIVWMYCVFVLGATVDAGMAALLASFVTMFIKMAADASGYQYASSAGSDKKDDNQAKASEKLLDKVPVSGAPTVITPWWSALTEPERFAITAAVPTDARAAQFMVAAQTGKAAPEDLDHLVTLGLLTQARADAIKAT